MTLDSIRNSCDVLLNLSPKVAHRPPLVQAELRVKHVDLIFPINCIWQQGRAGENFRVSKLQRSSWRLSWKRGSFFPLKSFPASISSTWGLSPHEAGPIKPKKLRKDSFDCTTNIFYDSVKEGLNQKVRKTCRIIKNENDLGGMPLLPLLPGLQGLPGAVKDEGGNRCFL